MQESSRPQNMVIITAPSGSGKTTIVNYLLQEFPELAFSISACTRLPRSGETDGVNYYFISTEDFKTRIEQHEFAEYEMVYEGKYYGTPKTELQRIWNLHKTPLIDIDVHGALRLKRQFQQNALIIFIKAPSLEVLEERLRNRGTETEYTLRERLDKAGDELNFADQFDYTVVNDHLERACAEVKKLVATFLGLS
jgi:guanylate kinase